MVFCGGNSRQRRFGLQSTLRGFSGCAEDREDGRGAAEQDAVRYDRKI